MIIDGTSRILSSFCRATPWCGAVAALAITLGSMPVHSQETRFDPRLETETAGPVRLRQTTPQRLETPTEPKPAPSTDARSGGALSSNGTDRRGPDSVNGRIGLKAPPDEFEAFVQGLAGLVRINRFGSELVATAVDRGVVDFNPLVPPDYLIKPGDEILLTIWGAADADLQMVVDRAGRISIPRVGAVQVSGVRYADLPDAISRRVAQSFRNFQLTVSLGQLRGVRVYVTGFVARPGAATVSSLSTLTQALISAGGPSAAGSFRNIELRRAGKLESRFDLYDFLLNGDRSADRVVQTDDVIHVGPIGAQVALIGSVNRPAIFELKPGETVADVLRMAGGFSAVADRSRLAIERLDNRSDTRVAQIELPASERAAVQNGDLLRAFSSIEATLPVQKQNKRVRIEGEVVRPGDFVLPASSTIADALAAAGGMTSAAFVFGAEFNRESVRLNQQANYERALRDLELQLSKASSTQRVASADEASAAAGREASTTRLLDRLRLLTPTGRVVLQTAPNATELPNLMLEDGDRLFIPTRATSVGVFGSVFNTGSFLWQDGSKAQDYVQLAGGPTTGADTTSVFVVRVNGTVVSARQRGGRWSGRNLDGVEALPGDTIFMPDELNTTTLTQDLKDWSQIIFQLGLGVAAWNAVR